MSEMSNFVSTIMDTKTRNFLCAVSASVTAIIIKKKRRNGKRRSRRKIWSRNWLLQRNLDKDIAHLVMKELQLEDVNSFENFTRMPKSVFQKLHSKVEPLISKQNTILREAISCTSRLLLTLRFLATGETYRSLSYSFRISVPAISIIIPETLKAIYGVLKEEYLKMPQNKLEWKKIAEEFERQWNFPFCLGALDGKHIAIRASKKDGSYYYNYKGFNSIILLALVDANYNFLYVDVGCNGRVNDAGAYASSALCSGIQNNVFDFPDDECFPGTNNKVPHVIVADDAFRLTTRMLKPSGQRLSIEEKIFNYRLSRARRVVENAFGILANKFQVLQKDINLCVSKVELVVLTSCVLHNYIRKEIGNKYLEGIDQENINKISFNRGRWRNEVFLTKLRNPIGNRSANNAIEVRKKYMYYFNTVGFVPWQWEAVNKFNF